MEGKRGFEIVSTWKDAGISLPRRKTAMSAGYDIESAVETEVLPGEIKVIPTGLKAYMESDEYLAVYIRSDRKSTRLNSSHNRESRMPSSA